MGQGVFLKMCGLEDLKKKINSSHKLQTDDDNQFKKKATSIVLKSGFRLIETNAVKLQRCLCTPLPPHYPALVLTLFISEIQEPVLTHRFLKTISYIMLMSYLKS